MPLKSKVDRYKDLVNKYPDYIPPRIKLARYYVQISAIDPEKNKYLDNAIKEYTGILEKDPSNKDALFDLGNIYSSRKEDLPKAEGLYQKLIKLYPENSIYRIHLAINYYLRGMNGQAMNEIKKALIYDPENGPAYFWTAFLYAKYGDFPRAIDASKKAIKIFDSKGDTRHSMETRYLLGQIYFKVRHVFDSMQEFERIIKMDPSSESAYLELASIYQALGLNDKALNILAVSPLSPEGWGISFGRHSNITKDRKALICDIMGRAYLGKSDNINALKYFRLAKNYGVNYKNEFYTSLEKLASAQQKIQKSDKHLQVFVEDENAFIAKAALWNLGGKLSPDGDIAKNRASNLSSYGVSLEPGKNVNSYVRLSDLQLTEKYSLPENDIEALTRSLDKKNTGVVLGISRMAKDPWEGIEERYHSGDLVEGTITSVSNDDATIELEKGLYGVLPKGSSGVSASQPMKDIFKVNDVVKVKITGIDRAKKTIFLTLENSE